MKVVVVGGGISGLTAAFRLREAGHEVTCLEPGEHPGGTMRSERREGFLLEYGPQSILEGTSETRALVADLGLEAERVWPSAAARGRAIFVGGKLRALPRHPLSLLSTDLLSLRGKWRLVREPWVPKRAENGEDESISAFGERRLGPEAARNILAPAVIGVFAGDAARLSIQSAFPRVAGLERKHGSLFRGLRALRKEGGGLGGRSFSFRDGLARLPLTLAARLGASLVRASVRGLRREGERWHVLVQDAGGARTLAADAVVLATPPAVSAALLDSVAPAAARVLREIPLASAAVVSLGWRQAPPGAPRTGYGFLVARGEAPRLLGCQYESLVFPDRAPAGALLLRTIHGGVFEPPVVDLADEALVERTREDLKIVLGIDRPPDFTFVWRARPGIPQYELGHEARAVAVDRACAALPGLHLAGNALRGVSVNDCIRNATLLARRL